ncbi:hypothetical protein H0H87_001682 [Tephrocybe sp. NHM501043]|nr:hypothetical protein H0H87_001682 [Tephrocybe sp. NHM501043]
MAPVEMTSSSRKGLVAEPENCFMFASLSTGSQTALLFSSHALAIETYLRRKPSVEALGYNGDDLRELVDDLWNLHDDHGEGDNTDREDTEAGEDY